MKTLFYFTLSAFLFMTSSCIIDFDGGPFRCIDGNGNIITAEIPLPEVDEIALKIPANVTITQGDEQKIIVEGDENIVDRLKTKVNGGQWKIDTERCIRNLGTLNITMEVKEMKGIFVSGSGQVTSTNILVTDKMNLDISGSGDVDVGLDVIDLEARISGSGIMYLEGKTEYADYKISGSGDVRAFDLDSRRADITISGSGSVECTVEERLKVRISGSGDVFYQGDPTLDVSVSGSGDVVNAN